MGPHLLYRGFQSVLCQRLSLFLFTAFFSCLVCLVVFAFGVGVGVGINEYISYP